MKTSFGWEGRGMVHTVRGQTRGCAGKTVRSLTMRAIPQRFWCGFPVRGAISSVRTFTFTNLLMKVELLLSLLFVAACQAV